MSTNKKCFVIFPFKEPYESRYENIYEPALQEAGLKVVRAGGPGVEVIIEDIQKHIRESLICFADLTEENANVWYEVGYAYACGKKVVMVCDKNKREFNDLPFDIKHRSVIEYSKTIDKNENARLKLGLKISKDAEVKMVNAQKEILAEKDVPVTPHISASSKNPLDEIVYENLTKNDINVLKEILNFHKRHIDWGISEPELSQKTKHPILLSGSISRLSGGLYIDQRHEFRYTTTNISIGENFNKDKILSIFPTDKAIKFSKGNYSLFLGDAN